MNDLKFLITGCGRSGTNFLSQLISASGQRCGHEEMFNLTGSRDNTLRYESSWYAVPYLHDLPRPCGILHIVRDPAKVARSFYRIGLLSSRPWRHVSYGDMWRLFLRRSFYSWQSVRRWQFVAAHRRFLHTHTSCFELSDEVDRLYQYWFEWNSRIEEFARAEARPYLRIRIDDVNDRLEEAGAFLQLKHPLSQLPPTNPKTNYRPRPMPDRPMPPHVAELSRAYGFT